MKLFLSPKSYRTASLASLIPMYLLAGPLVGLWIGRWVCQKWHLGGWVLVGMMVLGFMAGVQQSKQIFQQLNDKEKSSDAK